MARATDARLLPALRQTALGSLMFEAFSYELSDHLIALGFVTCSNGRSVLTVRGRRSLRASKAAAWAVARNEKGRRNARRPLVEAAAAVA